MYNGRHTQRVHFHFEFKTTSTCRYRLFTESRYFSGQSVNLLLHFAVFELESSFAFKPEPRCVRLGVRGKGLDPDKNYYCTPTRPSLYMFNQTGVCSQNECRTRLRDLEHVGTLPLQISNC